MPKCTKCNQDKKDDDFNFNKSKGRLENHCKKCHSEYLKDHYQRRKQYYKDKARLRQLDIRDWFVDHKSKLSCEFCSENHPACLDFHHEDPNIKEAGISDLVRQGSSVEKILAEIQKCKVLCANCHRKLHWNNMSRPIVRS